MESIQVGQKFFLRFKNLSQSGVFHFSSTKPGWGEEGKSRFTGDEPSIYKSYRDELANGFSMENSQFIFPRQVHGKHVEIIEGPIESEDIPETDALITKQSGICVCVQTADCVPILIFDPVQKVIAAVHAGWRGTVDKIVSKTIFSMQRKFNSFPEDLIVGIGPSIHMHVYEVGHDVINQVREKLTNYKQLLKPSIHPNKAYFDLWEANRTLLTSTGVLPENIEIMGFCSFSHEDFFYSARRDGADTGRMVSGIMLTGK